MYAVRIFDVKRNNSFLFTERFRNATEAKSAGIEIVSKYAKRTGRNAYTFKVIAC